MPTKRLQFIDFRAVKDAVTMGQVLDHFKLTDTFKRTGDSLSGPCPIHQGNNPTQFRVSLTKNCWNCFSDCKCGGNVLDFVAKMENCSIREAAFKLAEWFNLSTNESSDESRQRRNAHVPAGPAKRPEATSGPVEKETVESPAEIGSNKPLGFTLKDLDATHPYLSERGLTAETIAHFGVGLCNAGSMIGRIVIPIHNSQSELVGYIGRWPGEPPKETPKYKLPKNFKKSAEVFNLHRALAEPAEKPLIIVEGVFDVIRLWQADVRKVVALMGSSLSPAQEQLILNSETSHVIVMLDEDEAGRKGREDIVQRLAANAFVRIIKFDEPDKQPEHLTPEEISEMQLEAV